MLIVAPCPGDKQLTSAPARCYAPAIGRGCWAAVSAHRSTTSAGSARCAGEKDGQDVCRSGTAARHHDADPAPPAGVEEGPARPHPLHGVWRSRCSALRDAPHRVPGMRRHPHTAGGCAHVGHVRPAEHRRPSTSPGQGFGHGAIQGGARSRARRLHDQSRFVHCWADGPCAWRWCAAGGRTPCSG